MIQLASGFLVALVLSFGLTFWIRGAAHRLGLVDAPDGGRKAHDRPIPHVGGVAIFVGAGLTVVLGALIGVEPLLRSQAQVSLVVALIVGATAIFLLGVVDDTRGLKAGTKFAVEVGVATALAFAGVRIGSFGPVGPEGLVIPALVGIPLTIVWITGVTNSFNLLDGSDGVAGGSAFFALVTMGFVSVIFGKEPVAAISFVLAGATLGFLFFNFPPASIFLGDSGSLLLGFSLATMGVIATQAAPTILAIAIPLAAFGVPILDTGLAIVRRFLRRERIFTPDRGHIHHRLRDLGHSPRRVALVVYLLTAALCVFSLLVAGGRTAQIGVSFVVVGVILVIFVQRLRIPELLELGKLVNWGRLQRVVIERHMRVREAAERLGEATTSAQVLAALEHAFRDGEFSHMELWLEDRYAAALTGEPWREDPAMHRCVSLELAHARSPQEVELRLPLALPGREPAGVLTLYRPVDGTRILTDLTVLVEELQPGLLRCLEGLSQRVEGVRKMSEAVRREPGEAGKEPPGLPPEARVASL